MVLLKEKIERSTIFIMTKRRGAFTLKILSPKNGDPKVTKKVAISGKIRDARDQDSQELSPLKNIVDQVKSLNTYHQKEDFRADKKLKFSTELLFKNARHKEKIEKLPLRL